MPSIIFLPAEPGEGKPFHAGICNAPHSCEEGTGTPSLDYLWDTLSGSEFRYSEQGGAGEAEWGISLGLPGGAHWQMPPSGGKVWKRGTLCLCHHSTSFLLALHTSRAAKVTGTLRLLLSVPV